MPDNRLSALTSELVELSLVRINAGGMLPAKEAQRVREVVRDLGEIVDAGGLTEAAVELLAATEELLRAHTALLKDRDQAEQRELAGALLLAHERALAVGRSTGSSRTYRGRPTAGAHRSDR